MAKYSVEIYKIDVVNQKLSRIDVIDTFMNLQFFNKLNGIGGAKFELSIFDKRATRNNLTRFINQVVIKRDDTIVFFGPITNISSQFTNVRGNLVIDCQSYMYHLKTRYTGQLVQYTDIDQGQYLWGLIDTTQNLQYGDLLINMGVIQPSSDINSTCEYTNIADELTKYASLIDGVDFTFTPTVDSNNLLTHVNFNVWYPRLANRRVELNSLQVGQNIQSIDFKTYDSIYNAITGQGSGSDQVYNSFIEYGSSETAYTRREALYPLKSYTLPETISFLTQAYANIKSVEQFTIDLVLYPNVLPTYDQLNLGDIIPLNIKVENVEGYAGDYVNFKGDARLTELAVAVDNTGKETITPKLSLLN